MEQSSIATIDAAKYAKQGDDRVADVQQRPSRRAFTTFCVQSDWRSGAVTDPATHRSTDAVTGWALAAGRVLTPQDSISIKVTNQPDMDTSTRVETDGTITPLVGPYDAGRAMILRG